MRIEGGISSFAILLGFYYSLANKQDFAYIILPYLTSFTALDEIEGKFLFRNISGIERSP
jgi:hypothetical protein